MPNNTNTTDTSPAVTAGLARVYDLADSILASQPMPGDWVTIEYTNDLLAAVLRELRTLNEHVQSGNALALHTATNTAVLARLAGTLDQQARVWLPLAWSKARNIARTNKRVRALLKED